MLNILENFRIINYIYFDLMYKNMAYTKENFEEWIIFIPI